MVLGHGWWFLLKRVPWVAFRRHLNSLSCRSASTFMGALAARRRAAASVGGGRIVGGRGGMLLGW